MNPKPDPIKRGAAVAEFAICLPVLLMLVLGGIECTTMIFVEQSLHVVAYEGVRAAIKSDGTDADTLARCQEVVAERNVRDALITLQPRSIESLDRGTPIIVTASAPCRSNAVLGLTFFSGATLQAQAVMFKE